MPTYKFHWPILLLLLLQLDILNTPALSAAGLLSAVMSYEACSCLTSDCSVCTDYTNGGCKITQMHYKNILKWR